MKKYKFGFELTPAPNRFFLTHFLIFSMLSHYFLWTDTNNNARIIWCVAPWTVSRIENHASPKSAAHHIILILAQLGEKYLRNLFCDLPDKVISCINYPMLFMHMEIMTGAKRDQKCLRKKRQNNLPLWSALIIFSVIDKGSEK